MAVTALELHIRPVRSAPNRLHVQRVVELDGTGVVSLVSLKRAKFRELRVPVLKTNNMLCVYRTARSGHRLEIGVTLRARPVAYGG